MLKQKEVAYCAGLILYCEDVFMCQKQVECYKMYTEHTESVLSTAAGRQRRQKARMRRGKYTTLEKCTYPEKQVNTDVTLPFFDCEY